MPQRHPNVDPYPKSCHHMQCMNPETWKLGNHALFSAVGRHALTMLFWSFSHYTILYLMCFFSQSQCSLCPIFSAFYELLQCVQELVRLHGSNWLSPGPVMHPIWKTSGESTVWPFFSVPFRCTVIHWFFNDHQERSIHCVPAWKVCASAREDHRTQHGRYVQVQGKII